MLRHPVFLAFGMILALGTSPALADKFAGFYQGLDGEDGSLDSMSIVPNGDGTYTMRIRADRYGYCLDEEGHRSAFVTATGRVIDGNLVRQDALAFCEGADEPISIPDFVYDFDARNGILSVDAPRLGRILYYHRISD
jgi:hypothetical protein